MTIRSKFAGICKACGCSFNAGDEIEWTKANGARHATINACAAAKALRASQAPPTGQFVATLNLQPLVKFLQDARDRGLKHPKLRILDVLGSSELVIGLTLGGAHPGTLSVVDSQKNFIGGVRPDGSVIGKLTNDRVLQGHLINVAIDPAAAAKKYAVLMCRCSFCGLPLTDEGSVEVGYGPVCAAHWGLPHSPKGTSNPVHVPQPGTPTPVHVQIGPLSIDDIDFLRGMIDIDVVADTDADRAFKLLDALERFSTSI